MNIILFSPTSLILAICSVVSCTGYWLKDGTLGNEISWSKRKEWPQYKYLSRPIYKFVASKTNTVFATGVSFFVTDLLMHQLLPQLIICMINMVLPSPIPICPGWSFIAWYPLISLGWLSVAFPVMYSKYLKLKKLQKDS